MGPRSSWSSSIKGQKFDGGGNGGRQEGIGRRETKKRVSETHH